MVEETWQVLFIYIYMTRTGILFIRVPDGENRDGPRNTGLLAVQAPDICWPVNVLLNSLASRTVVYV
jgi:hypothetical protein